MSSATPSSTGCVSAAESASESAGRPSNGGQGARFRPDIEGLRAIAVLAVLGYHAGLPLSGGFVGVDIFFVISGFLITGLLVREVAATGALSWTTFIGRRIRRLLPAAVLVLVATAAVSFLLIPGQRRQVVGHDIAASAAYVVNWVFADRGVDYLASDATPSPVQHFWSLAVEEQFYVVWPLLILGLLWLRPAAGRRHLGAVLAVLTVGSLAWSVRATAATPTAAFFTTTTRLWELGVGALLAIALAGPSPRRLPVRASAGLGWFALVVLAAVIVALPHDLPWPSAWALLPTVATAALLWVGASHGQGASRLLAVGPMQWVGKLSYSIYLWHWPVLILGEWAALRLGTELSTLGRGALALGSVGPAYLSWRFVENPIHHGGWLRGRPRALLVSGLALSAVGALAAVPLLPLRSPFVTTPPAGQALDPGALGAAVLPSGTVVFADRDDPGWVTPDPLLAGTDRPAADVDRCQVDARATVPVRCTFGPESANRTIALVGDSKAMQWLPALTSPDADWRVVTYGKSSCAFADAPATLAGAAYPACDAWNDAVLRALVEDPPDLVVTSGVARGAWTASGTSAEALADGYARQWSALARRAVPVLVLADSPVSPDTLDVCAAWHPRELTRCSFPREAAVAGSGRAVQELAVRRSEQGVEWLDLTEAICPADRCPVVIGHVAVHRAGDHLTATYAASLAPQIAVAVSDALRARR